ncbi:flagellar basal body P-ring formation chaperone FlgA [Pectobacteriaceae bacterium CE90]|nr:flagellar basal body P-ring formation chaperone FlgA [Prodigiosinella sp. LS101]WJV56080.1 flagellar basal body P-ring formation chaperone FlgA [Prodigiosinella sp. LS101]WJV60449.1 flagellar basal body P-ring formation chaperone FlgA [Pectobacteriaceae bacterium C111]WJY17192.1 flagellar basal body P-ring formation chaperone FlgA [Pectobacteriaceae bacterium CE90]
MPTAAIAADLQTQLNNFFASNFQNSPDHINVVIKSPQSQWLQCDNPQLSLSSNAKVWGNVSVSIRCNQQRRFIQVNVQVTGNYVVTSRMIPRGTTLSNNDLRITQGRLDQLPTHAILLLNDAQGAIALRNIAPGQAVTSVMIRKPWVIHAGQNVQILVQGTGFTIRNEGKAMNNAAIGQSARVRTPSGQIVSGVVNEDGIILISQ